MVVLKEACRGGGSNEMKERQGRAIAFAKGGSLSTALCKSPDKKEHTMTGHSVMFLGL